jgi:carboxypeptidase Q
MEVSPVMKQAKIRMFTAGLFCLLAASVFAQQSGVERIEDAMIAKIKDEGLRRSQVMDHISWLSDVYGPRLAGSPTIKQASQWAQKRFQEWGLANIHEEPWMFGKGWSLERRGRLARRG